MLPHDAKARKALPLYTFLTQYFPDALTELVKVSVAGNEQHNPGEPLHWARGKSTDQLDAAMRHLFDHGVGIRFGVDGQRTLAQAAWRLLAQLQLDLEKETAGKAPGAAIDTPPATRLPPISPGRHRDEGELLYATSKLILRLESDDPDTVGECNGEADNQDPQRNTDEELRAAGSAISDRGQVARQECFEQSVRERKSGRKG